METWKPIAGYDGIYEVSDLGRIRSLRNQGKRTFVGKILKSRPDKDGYLVVTFTVLCRKQIKRVNRLVATAFLPNPNNCSDVNHRNGIKSDNTSDNLEWVTHADNQKHAGELGLMATGARNGSAKLRIQRLQSADNFKTDQATQQKGTLEFAASSQILPL